MDLLLKRVGDEIPLKTVEKNGYTAILPPAPAALGYSKDALIIVINSNPEKAAAIPGQLDDRFAGRNALPKDSGAAALLQRPHDLGVWLDINKAMDVLAGGLGNLADFGILPNVEGAEISATVRFEPGSVALSVMSTSDVGNEQIEIQQGRLGSTTAEVRSQGHHLGCSWGHKYEAFARIHDQGSHARSQDWRIFRIRSAGGKRLGADPRGFAADSQGRISC